MNFIQKKIIEKITEYNKIALFFHEIPDFDALGSCFALKTFLTDKFHKKQVKIVGLDILDPNFGKEYFHFDKTHVTNEFLKDSLGIVLDVANESRVWSSRHRFCKELIRIDHHPQIEAFCDIEWIDDKSPATCELVGRMLYEWDEAYLSAIVASYLYAGIITDTGRFIYESTRPETFFLSSQLIKRNFDRNDIYKSVYLKSFKQYKFESYLVSKIKLYKNVKFGYVVIPRNAFDRYDIELRTSMVHVFNNIKELHVWMSIYYDNTIRKWRGSLRSRFIPINFIAEKYHGGGHKFAAGFTLDKKQDYRRLVKDLIKYLNVQIKNRGLTHD